MSLRQLALSPEAFRQGDAFMPKIDLASIPGLEPAQALFGAVKTKAAVYDDTIVDIMVYVYDTVPPPPPPPGIM